MSLEFVIVILVVIYLRRTFKTAAAMPVWNKRLLLTMYVAIACLILQKSISSTSILFDFVGYIMIGGLLYIIYKQPEFKSARFLYTAILPYLIAVFTDEVLKLLSKNLYSTWSGIINTAKTFAVIWGIGVWIVTRKQQKELSKARSKVLEEEENNKVITAMKAQLEIQVAERTAELTKQKEELEITLNELKSTQAQLIQSEKMASLGELTAGIAHEIQNPLNFVNNFAEVNTELIEELRGERTKEKNERNEVFEDEIFNDISSNLEKISFHGKRADSIVKGMLQHSRKNTGQKESTDINVLADEYLRLSYHGLRAKDKSFNAEIKTDFDKSAGTINIVSQDIGRALLNLFNNAFYAVYEKEKSSPITPEGGTGKLQNEYKPIVAVSTKLIPPLEGKREAVQIKVTDNGKGMPQNIIDKIFQPFFTTKPTGEGTGLGLSLSYDIVTKEHNGTIKVNTIEGEGSTFIIQLPIT